MLKTVSKNQMCASLADHGIGCYNELAHIKFNRHDKCCSSLTSENFEDFICYLELRL